MMVNFYFLQCLMEIVKEIGEMYYKFDGLIYKLGEYFDKYVINDYSFKY